jgi:hypothetical protein
LQAYFVTEAIAFTLACRRKRCCNGTQTIHSTSRGGSLYRCPFLNKYALAKLESMMKDSYQISPLQFAFNAPFQMGSLATEKHSGVDYNKPADADVSAGLPCCGRDDNC